MEDAPILSVCDLSVDYLTEAGPLHAVQDVGFSLRAGRSLALVGESGSGKSTIVKALLRMLPSSGRVVDGSCRFKDDDLLAIGDEAFRQLRAVSLSLVTQAAMNALDPVRPIDDQIVEIVRTHTNATRREALELACQALEAVGISRQRAHSYPHQFSGGMRQRAMIAMATVLRPKILIADEATTGLDVIVQDRVLATLEVLQAELDLSMIVVTHDLGVAAELCDDVIVLKDGRVVEQGPMDSLLRNPQEEYTKELIDSGRSHVRTAPARGPVPALQARAVSVRYASGRGLRAANRKADIVAVQDVDLNIHRGEIVGLAGESGCGKSSLAMAMMGLAPMSSGSITVDEAQMDARTSQRTWREARRHVQLIFQDPYASLNPRFTVRRTLRDALVSQGLKDNVEERISSAMKAAELVPVDDYMHRRPFSLSGGERQRVSIARALVLRPSVLVADEPVSMLDRTTGEQIALLMRRLVEEHDLSILLISHDMSLLERVCDRIAVMYLGRVVEMGQTADVILQPRHPYTRALIAATPTTDPDAGRQRVALPGGVPSNMQRPQGCAFHPRCSHADATCLESQPELVPGKHRVACFHPLVEERDAKEQRFDA